MTLLTLTPTHHRSPRLEAIRREKVNRALEAERKNRFDVMMTAHAQADHDMHSAALVSGWQNKPITAQPVTAKDITGMVAYAVAFFTGVSVTCIAIVLLGTWGIN